MFTVNAFTIADFCKVVNAIGFGMLCFGTFNLLCYFALIYTITTQSTNKVSAFANRVLGKIMPILIKTDIAISGIVVLAIFGMLFYCCIRYL